MIDHSQVANDALLITRENALSAGKPVLLIGPESDRRAVLERMALVTGAAPLNLNVQLVQPLTDAAGSRIDLVGVIATLDRADAPLLLDRVQILMLPQLRVNAIDLLCRVARRRPTCVSWPGRLEGGRLRYANHDHPECLDEDASRVLVIDLLKNEGADR